MTDMDFPPIILNQAHCSGGSIELVEWRWPSMMSFSRIEHVLMVEMSLPPLAVDASACFPDLAPNQYCFMGRLFVRFPGVKVDGRSEGGHIRVLRCCFPDQSGEILTALSVSRDIEFLKSLLNLRSDTLRRLMALAHRELINPSGYSQDAMEAYHRLIGTELRRILAGRAPERNSGRLAPWQYRRIRERLMSNSCRPTAQELAQLCGISARHLHRQFLNLTGESVANYVENFRIKQAKDMLMMPGISIKVIAASCGFAHPNSFARAFYRSTGLSPARFRQRFRSRSEAEPSMPPARINTQVSFEENA